MKYGYIENLYEVINSALQKYISAGEFSIVDVPGFSSHEFAQKRKPYVAINTSDKIASQMVAFFDAANISYEKENNVIKLSYLSCLDALQIIFDETSSLKQQQYPIIKFAKEDPAAIIPTKHLGSDIGYDLTFIKIIENTGARYLVDTGIIAIPPPGYYFDLVPRSSFCKTGFIFNNCVGIIDPGYRGSIKISLTKTEEATQDLICPQKWFQLVLRKAEFAHAYEVSSGLAKWEITARGQNGFGSSDKK